MNNLSRKEKIFNKLLLECQQIDFTTSDKNYIYGFDAGYLADKLSLRRENVSRDLNLLYRENRLLKIKGKPIHFLPRDLIEGIIDNTINEYIFEDQLSFSNYIQNNYINSSIATPDTQINSATLPTSEETVNPPAISPFTKLIGNRHSLSMPVKQAIASILYPPNGLHTLILGPTGCGKTTFASVMYAYAIYAKRFNEDTPFIIFNCADYSGNPQLLLSHLFGHVKGSFTGASSNKEGIIDKANNGILFLDEIHRLPPEGQEMLFSLIDRGEFYRLGDSSTPHFAKVLIIAATTENPDTSVLKTFLRRIPNTIHLPGLEKRSLEERFELIKFFFKKEAQNMGTTLTVSAEILKLLLIYDCPGNIGQLENDIKLICANSFANYITERLDTIQIKLSQLPTKYLQFFDILDKKRDELNILFNWNSVKELSFTPTDEITPSAEDHKQHNFYTTLLRTSKKYFSEGLSLETMKSLFDTKIANYFEHSPYKELSSTQNQDEFLLLKITSPEIYHVVKESIDLVKNQYHIDISSKVFHGLILHISTLIERVKAQKPFILPKATLNKSKDSNYFSMAKIIVDNLSTKLNITIPEQETFVIALYLQALDKNKPQKNIGILVITHGKSAAIDFADTANQLLQTNHAHALTMPLNEKVSTTLSQATKMVQDIDEGKGVLLLVDMGSLTTFGDIITKNTGIKTRTIRMVSTPMVLEATSKATFPGMTLDRLVKEVTNLSSFVGSNTVYHSEHEFLSKTLHLDYTRITHLIESVLTFIDTRKAIPLLEKVFYDINEKLNIKQEQSLYIKFTFHSACLLERAIRNDQLDYKNLKHLILEHQSIYNAIKNAFNLIERTYNIIIADGEFAYLTEIFLPYEKNKN